MKIAKTLMIAVMLLGLTACAHKFGSQSVANEDAQSVSAKIKNGKTTKTDIRQLFGSPSTVTTGAQLGGTPNEVECWIYTFNKTSVGAASYIPIAGFFLANSKSSSKNLAVFFDKNGVVTNHTFSSSDGNYSAQ